MSAGAAAHPKDMRRPPFSAPPTPRAATAGPPEASTAPGPSSTPARTATAGVASRSPRGNHRTAPDPARISRIRADAESAAPAGGVAGASWLASASRMSAAPARGRRDPIPVPAPSRSAPVGPRERHITRENVCPGYVLAGCPAISRVKRRSRGGRGVRCGSRGAPPRRRGRGARRGPSRPPSSGGRRERAHRRRDGDPHGHGDETAVTRSPGSAPRGPARVRRRGPALTARPTRVIMAAPGSRPPPTPGLPGPGWRDPKPGWAGVGLRNSDSLLNEIPGPGPVRTGPSLRNASSARRSPSRLAPCEPSATESACARFLRAHLAQCDLR